jgi:hypothetical protein
VYIMAQSYAFFGRLESSIFYIFGSPIVGERGNNAVDCCNERLKN